MNPYRDHASRTWTPRPKRSRIPVLDWLATLLLCATLPILSLSEYVPWIVWTLPFTNALAILILVFGKRSTAIGRMSRIMWHRGHRGDAIGVYLGITQPRYSRARIERQRIALERAQVGMPKLRAYWGPRVLGADPFDVSEPSPRSARRRGGLREEHQVLRRGGSREDSLMLRSDPSQIPCDLIEAKFPAIVFRK